MDPERDGTRCAHLDEIVPLDVVNLDVPVETAREFRRDERLQLVVAGTPREPTRDQQGLVAGWDAETLQLGHGRSDRGLTGVALGPRQRQLWRLGDARRAGAPAHESLEGVPGQRKAEG